MTLLEEKKRGFQEEDFLLQEDSEVIVTVIYDGAENAVTLLDDRNAEPGDTITLNPIVADLDGKDVILFIIPNNTVETYLTNPWRYTAKGNDNRTKRQPLFTLNNANPQAND